MWNFLIVVFTFVAGAAAECSSTFTSPSGTFTSYSYGSQSCDYVVQPRYSSYVRLSFTQLDISDTDQIEIYDGASSIYPTQILSGFHFVGLVYDSYWPDVRVRFVDGSGDFVASSFTASYAS